MGAYDIYEGIQIKAGNVRCNTYKIGDKTDLPNGIYFGYEGFIVIDKGIFIAKSRYNIFDKWGRRADPSTITYMWRYKKHALKGIDDFFNAIEAGD